MEDVGHFDTGDFMLSPLLSPPSFTTIWRFLKWYAKSPLFTEKLLVQSRDFHKLIQIHVEKTIFVKTKPWHAKGPPPF